MMDYELTPQEAIELRQCFINESFRRYSKVNPDVPILVKLEEIINPKSVRLQQTDKRDLLEWLDENNDLRWQEFRQSLFHEVKK